MYLYMVLGMGTIVQQWIGRQKREKNSKKKVCSKENSYEDWFSFLVFQVFDDEQNNTSSSIENHHKIWKKKKIYMPCHFNLVPQHPHTNKNRAIWILLKNYSSQT